MEGAIGATIWFVAFAIGFLTAGLNSSASSTPILLFQRHRPRLTDTQTRVPGDLTVIKANGLAPNQRYSMVLTLNLGSLLLSSNALFTADSEGTIDTRSAVPLAGTYTHPDPDGLFWSMGTVYNDRPPGQSPIYRLTLKKENTVLATATLPLRYTDSDVRQIALEEETTGLVGTLFLPRSDEPLPAVITYSGSEGGTTTGEMQAAALAREGFVGLGIAYFGAPGVPDQLAEIPLEYFQRAIDFLQSLPEVQPEKIAVMGPSRGGELSLLLGATLPQIKAVIALVPSPYRWGANIDSTTPTPAWTFAGLNLPFLDPVGDLVPVRLADGRTAYQNRPSFEAALAQTDQADEAMSAIENTNGPILMVGGDDDQVWPSCRFSELAMQRLKDHHHPFHDQSYCYKGAGHLVGSVPWLPTEGMDAVFHPYMGVLLQMGGTAEADAAGQRDFWTRAVGFLRQRLNHPR
ncbi:MAG: hypothetical protein C5B49_13460 [Bdellovibrio sp.]|nr:MAG: hypothetical protein C5B49_13460 [Bdellovibrio sp.]